ncbi:MAG: sigma 54-interacting transcriptional regulator [Deltaproteobacteria bacterium]|nr:sigma 54-interacting transcriptional regulator [Deltaproteobacteria bacterium]
MENVRNASPDEKDKKCVVDASLPQNDTDFKAICDLSHVGLFMLQDGVLSYVNPYLCNILGFERPDELIGKTFHDLVHPRDHVRYNLEIQEFKDVDTIGLHVFRMTRKDGTAIWVRTDSSSTILDGKEVYFGHLNDITKFMEVERGYRDSLERYRKMFDEVVDGLAEVDLKGNVILANQGAVRIWAGNLDVGNIAADFFSSSVTGRNFRSYMDPETAKTVSTAYNHIYKTGFPGKLSYEITRRDGVRRMVEDSVSLIRSRKGDITGFRVSSRDITRRMEEEKQLAEHKSRLEAIFQSVNDAIITVDPELRVIEANKSTENICPVVIPEIIGKPLSQCLQQCSQSCIEVLKQTLETKKAIREYRTECGHQGHPWQLVSVNSSPLLDPAGRFMGAVLVIRDITLLRNLERELRERHQFQNIIGKSKRMQDIYNLLEDLADLDTTVLITGESGTGKELIARALHYGGQRAFKPFVTVNCSALTESLLESELFGHVRGAFTGAIRDKQGRFQLADGGTILLDEIGDISPLIQLKLLRVLQEKEFEPVGESNPRKVDVRVVACTNKDLKEKVNNGEFRQDLYYRLKVMEIALPPLRDRLEDLLLLVDHFCRSFNEQFKKRIEGISDEVLRRFMDYAWPGNVRELQHAMEHAFVLCRGELITPEHLPAEIRDDEKMENVAKNRKRADTNDVQAILDALSAARWNKTKAAHFLGISRRTLHRKINEHNIMDIPNK